MPKRRSRSPAPPLRTRILHTARALLNEQGPAALSMREVARRAHVTHQAPYHHFGDRESILAALVTQGFDELAHALAEAIDRHSDQRGPAMAEATGAAYVGFALSNPGLFHVMFSPDQCDPGRFPEAFAAGVRAYAELERLVRTVHGTQATEELQDIYWAHVHGLSVLLLDGPMSLRHATPAARLAQAKRVGRVFARLVAPSK